MFFRTILKHRRAKSIHVLGWRQTSVFGQCLVRSLTRPTHEKPASPWQHANLHVTMRSINLVRLRNSKETIPTTIIELHRFIF